jgi:hypothetical protein
LQPGIVGDQGGRIVKNGVRCSHRRRACQ